MLRIDNLCKRYSSRSVLQDLSFMIQPGEIYGLLGPNGAGKTTTINVICGLLRADSGQVYIQGRPAGSATKSFIGVMPQENLLYRSLTCAENLAFLGQIYGLRKQQRQQRVQQCLQAVNLMDRANTPVERLSGGMQRRLCLAAAMVHRPKLLILDEPTTGLDIEARYEVWNLIKQLRLGGMTILLTTHLLDEVERLCHRIGIIKGGRLLAEGTLEELRKEIPAQEVVTVDTKDPEGAIACARRSGFIPRYYGSDLTFWIPEYLELKDLLDRFNGVALDSISRSPVRLEHIYVEVTQGRTAHDEQVSV